MIGQLRDIKYSITHIDRKCDANIIIKKCIVQHCTLMKCRDSFQKIYGPVILLMMVTNAVVLCSLIYQITQLTSLTILKAILLATYITIKVCQTYMYSWCGTHITMESEEYRNAIYASNWYGNKRFMIAVLTMLQQRPIILTVSHFSTISIDIFIKILNTSISFLK
ncbi:odorant receptor 47a-like [Chelonus insularis]|uniref:odorant receptor 47a-like n=1 Tax=Chelonus insularis TaxID=460826 RepID=UPI00158E5D75|nr:odorant receptor 47a-like [Chelonus insularis]